MKNHENKRKQTEKLKIIKNNEGKRAKNYKIRINELKKQ